MKPIFITVFTILFAFKANAQSGTATFSLSEGDVFASGQTVDVNDEGGNCVATITFGESGGAAFTAAVAYQGLDGFKAYTNGNGVNGNKAGGTFYTIIPQYNGSIDLAVVLNQDKNFFVEEDGVAMDDYNGITTSEKYYGTFSFQVEGGHQYKAYCSGSKLGFFGIRYEWDVNGGQSGDDNGNQGGDDQEEDFGIGTGTVRYASPDGTSSTGLSADQPGKLATMIGKLNPGDVLYLLDGQYDLTASISINKSGTASKYIMIAAAEGAHPILDFRKQANGNNGVKVGGSYLYIKGLTVRYAGYKGIWVENGKYNILENLDVYGCCNSGIQLRSGGNNMVINCDSHDNFDYQTDGGNADGFADKQGDACPGNIYIGCRAWSNSDDGWDSFQRVTTGTPTVYVNCITYNNGKATFNLTSHPRANGVDKNLSCFSGKSLTNFANGGNPNGFKLGGKGTKHDAELYRCLAIQHLSKGFDQNNNAGKMKVVNCTAYKNKINYGFGNAYPYTLYVYNCVSLSPTGGSSSSNHLSTSSSGTVYQGNNTWNTGYTVAATNFESTDIADMMGEKDEFGNQLLLPRNEDGTLPEMQLLHIKPTASNLIDKGRNYNSFEGEKISKYVAFSGSAPDLGYFEYATADGIISIEAEHGTINPDAPCFDLNGRRVDASYRGIVVQYGKKFYQNR